MSFEDFKMPAKPFLFKGMPDKWHEWRDLMEGIFWGMDLYQAIENPRPEEPPAAVAPPLQEEEGGGGQPVVVAPPQPVGPNLLELWNRRSAKIYMFLQMYTTGMAKSVVSQHRETGNGVEAWAALKNRYEHQGSLGKTIVYKQIASMVWGPKTDPDTFFLDLERNCLRLEQLGEPFGEGRMMSVILEKLPKNIYRPIVTLFDTVEGEMTYDAMKQHLRIFYQRDSFDRNGCQGSDPGANALAARERERSAGGHNDRKMETIQCYKCRKFGHVMRNCTEDPGTPDVRPFASKSKGDPKSSGGGRRNAPWRSTPKAGKKDYTKPGSKKQTRFADGSNSDGELGDEGTKPGTLYLVTEEESALRSCEDLETFVVDTGATSHMVSSAHGLTAISHDPSGKVRVAGGNVTDFYR
jgi:hypothetical protein